MKFEPHESSSGGLPSAEDKWGEIPAMPVVLRSPSHRQKHNYPSGHDGIALAARTVSTKEITTNPKAKAADDAEWNDLRKMQTWDESTLWNGALLRDEPKPRTAEST